MKAAIVLYALMHAVLSKLVVYGPQELIDSFEGKSKSIWIQPLQSHPNQLFFLTEAQINANYANFGHIPYGQSLVSNLIHSSINRWLELFLSHF